MNLEYRTLKQQILTITLILASLLFSCTKAEPENTLLSSTLAQMKTSGNPFGNDFDTNRYALFQGQCPSLVKSFQITAPGNSWFDVPTQAPGPVSGSVTYLTPEPDVTIDYSGDKAEGEPPSSTYDLDCSDGYFSFWVYSHQFDEWIASTGQDPENFHPTAILLRGVSESGTPTEITTYQLDDHSDGGPPTNIVMAKEQPISGAINEKCFGVRVELKSADGSQASTKSAIAFGLKMKINTGPLENFDLYQEYGDCEDGFSALTSASLEIPAHTDHVYYYIKHTGLSIGDQVALQLNHTGELSTAGSDISYQIYENSDFSLRAMTPHRVVSGPCYSIPLEVKMLDDGTPSFSMANFNISKPSELKLYSDQSCSSEITSTLSMTSSSTKIYLKLTSTVSTSGTITFNYSSGLTGQFVPNEVTIPYDLSGDTTPARVEVWVHGPILQSTDARYSIGFYNSRHTPIPAGASGITVNLSSSFGSDGTFSDTINPVTITSLYIAPGDYYGQVDFNTSLSGTGYLLFEDDFLPSTTQFDITVGN